MTREPFDPAAQNAEATISAPITLPEDIVVTIHAFADEVSKQKRLLAYVLQDFLEDIPRGMKATLYELIADEWNRATGDSITGRTVRYWVQSVRVYSQEQLHHYYTLTDAQLVEAVKLASDCQNEFTPQDVCEWCVEKQIDSVAAMRAHWLPRSGTPAFTDPPALTGIIRWFGKLFKSDNPHRARIDEIIAELRGYLTESEPS